MNRYSSIYIAITLAAISACGSTNEHPPTIADMPAPIGGGEPVKWHPRSDSDPPYTVTIVNIEADGNFDVITKPLIPAEENAAVAAKMKLTVPTRPGSIDSTTSAISLDSSCPASAIWVYSQPDLQGAKTCLVGAGQVYMQAPGWMPVSRVDLLGAPLSNTKSWWPGVYPGVVSADKWSAPCQAFVKFPSYGAAFNFDAAHGVRIPQNIYLHQGPANGRDSVQCNNTAICGHPICVTGGPVLAGTIDLASCHDCIPLVRAGTAYHTADPWCGVSGWDQTCLNEAAADAQHGLCAPINQGGAYVGAYVTTFVIPGCP